MRLAACDPHLNQTKLNDLLPLTIDGVLGRTKKLSSRKRLGDQTTWRTNRIQEVERERKLNISIELDKNFNLAHPKYHNNLVIKQIGQQ